MEGKNELTIHIIANVTSGTSLEVGLSGGDRIFIECSRRWINVGHTIYIHVWEGGLLTCKRNELHGASCILLPLMKYKRFGLPMFELIRTAKAVINALKVRPPNSTKRIVIYSASSFLPDAVPAWILKMRFKKAKWVAGFYLFAPNPFSAESPYKGKKALRGLIYYLSQWPIYYLIKKYADMVWVTNEFDRWRFMDAKRLTPEKVIAVRGGVDTKAPALIPEPKTKKFDAVFIGRFHPQKGVLELIDIWRYVCMKKKDAKLAMIGVGELEEDVKKKIRRYGLNDNITLLGYKDGIEKLAIFKDSKIVLHPAIYDSGGMASCEAMACGLPGVSFDLPALKTYYPKGMLKTPCYDLKAFADNVLNLLEHKELYENTRQDALDWAKEWDWDSRANELLRDIEKLF